MCTYVLSKGSGYIVNNVDNTEFRITPGPMLKASLICHVEDKGIVNIPMAIGGHAFNTSLYRNIWLIHHRVRVRPVNTDFTSHYAQDSRKQPK